MNFGPQAFWTNGVESADLSYGRFIDDLAQAKVPVVKVGRTAPSQRLAESRSLR